MNRWIAPLLGAGMLCGALFGGCGSNHSSPAPANAVVTAQSNVVAIYNVSVAASNACVAANTPTDYPWGREWNFSYTAAAKNLRAIDTSACPSDFREGFLEFVQSVEHRARITPIQKLAKPISQAETNPLGMLAIFDNADDRAIYDAIAKMERLALKYADQLRDAGH